MTKTELKWSLRVAAWRASGSTAPEFVSGKEFTASALRNWAYTLKQRGLEGESPLQLTHTPVRMARVDRSPPAMLPSSLTVEVGAARVSVPAGFDAVTVRAVLGALMSAASGGAQ